MLCKEKAAQLGQVQVPAEMASGPPLSNLHYLQSGDRRGRARLFRVACDGRARDNRHKLKLEKFGLDTKSVFSLLEKPSNGAA